VHCQLCMTFSGNFSLYRWMDCSRCQCRPVFRPLDPHQQVLLSRSFQADAHNMPADCTVHATCPVIGIELAVISTTAVCLLLPRLKEGDLKATHELACRPCAWHLYICTRLSVVNEWKAAVLYTSIDSDSSCQSHYNRKPQKLNTVHKGSSHGPAVAAVGPTAAAAAAAV
jgi:hypothetical protein